MMATSFYWNSLIQSPSSIFSIINSNMCRMRDRYPKSLPDFNSSPGLIIASDYAGDNDNSPYQILSFLITSIDSCLLWDDIRKNFREDYFSTNRRMAFKNLNDIQRRKALHPFLEVVNHLPGLSFTVAIDNSINTLFESSSPLDLNNPDFLEYKSWKPKVLEKAFRVIHFAAFLIAGMSSPGQNVLWFSDEDDIAANHSRLTQLTKVFASVLSNYVLFDLGHIRCGTTQNDNGSLIIEDLASIPDLIAGAINEQLILNRNEQDLNNIFWILRPEYTKKTHSITWWFADANKPLKRYLCLIKSIKDSSSLSVSWFHFYNQVQG